jgi:hypothetical protein
MKQLSMCILLAVISVFSCGKAETDKLLTIEPVEFNPQSLKTEQYRLQMIRGQLLYMPVYSNIPYNSDEEGFDMKAYVAIHNTDLHQNIRVTKVTYFNHDGKPVYDFLKDGDVSLGPLATKDFHIPYDDKSGIGANFLIEWVSDIPVTRPLIECVTISLKPNQSLALLSRGEVIREIK